MITAIMPIEKGYPIHMAVNSKTNLIYLSYPDEDLILIVNPVLRSIKDRIQADCPETMAVNPVANKVYVLCSDGIYSIDGATNILKPLMNEKIHFGGGLDINPITNRIYTTSIDSGVLSIIDAMSGSTTAKININKNLRGVAVDPSSNKIYVLDPKTVYVIDGQSNQLADTIRIRREFPVDDSTDELDSILVNPISKLLYLQQKRVVTGYEMISHEGFILLVIDLDIKKRIQERGLHTGPTPTGCYQLGFALNSSNNVLYISDPRRNRISKFDYLARHLLQTIYLEDSSWWTRIFSEGVVQYGHALAINPLTNKVYVTNSNKNLLYEIDG